MKEYRRRYTKVLLLVTSLILLSYIPFVDCSTFFRSKQNSHWGRKSHLATASTVASDGKSLDPPAESLEIEHHETAATHNVSAKSVNTTITLPRWRQDLPAPLNQRSTLQLVRIPISAENHVNIYLLGTSHVSNDSSADVQLLLHHTEPDIVFVELCEQRVNLLTSEPSREEAEFDQNTSFWQQVKHVQEGAGQSRMAAVSTVLLTSVQKNYADSLGVELGSEFSASYQYVKRLAQSNSANLRVPILLLGDRPLQITLLRAWESLSLWHKTKVVVGLLWSSFKRPNNEELREWMHSILTADNHTDVLSESIKELQDHFPSLERVLLQERDAYMACKLYQMATMLPKQQNYTCVAIVGAGHGPGICDWLTTGGSSRPLNIDFPHLQPGKNPEEMLQGLVETKKMRDKDVSSLVQHITELPMNREIM